MASIVIYISSQSSTSSKGEEICREVADSLPRKLGVPEVSSADIEPSYAVGESILSYHQVGLDDTVESPHELSLLGKLVNRTPMMSNPFLDAKSPKRKRINLEGGVIVGWSSQEQHAVSDTETKVPDTTQPILKTEPEPEQTRNPSPSKTNPAKKRPWTSEKTNALEEGVRKHDCKCVRTLRDHGPQGTMSTHLSRRDEPQLKNKARMLSEGAQAMKDLKSSVSRVPKFWSSKELHALEQGMSVHGTSWARILADHGKDGKIDQVLSNRTQVQLKDKARSERALRERLRKPLGVFSLACSVSR